MILAALLLTAMGWSAQSGTIVVAHDQVIEGFDRTGEKKLWSANGTDSPSDIVVSPDGATALVLDAFTNRVAMVSIADGKVELRDMPATPVAAAYFGPDAWVILRERRTVMRLRDGTEVRVALDPAYIAADDQYLYVYSRANGLLQEIEPKSGELRRTADVGAGGSDLEIRKRQAFLCRPLIGRIVYVDLITMKSKDVGCGEMPMDVAIVPSGLKLSENAGLAFVVDTAKRMAWRAADPGEGRPWNLPTACDRIFIGGAGVFAFDSFTRTLYRLSGHIPSRAAAGVDSFASTDTTLFWWDATSGKLLH